MAERVGFEPSVAFTTSVLGAGAIGPDGKPKLDALRQARAMIGKTSSNKSNG